MKFLSKFSCLLIIAVTLFTSCDPYVDEENFLDEDMSCNDWCDIYTDFDNTSPYWFTDFDGDHGDCMSLCQTCNNPSNSAATSAVCACNWIDENRCLYR